MYPSEWHGNHENSKGLAKFKIEGMDFAVRLDSFADYQMISNMLELAFKQGKSFAAQAVRSHVMRALDDAAIQHAL